MIGSQNRFDAPTQSVTSKLSIGVRCNSPPKVGV